MVLVNKIGSKTTTITVGVELIVVGTVDVNLVVPDVIVVVCGATEVGTVTTTIVEATPLMVVGTAVVPATLPVVIVVVCS